MAQPHKEMNQYEGESIDVINRRISTLRGRDDRTHERDYLFKIIRDERSKTVMKE